jgi:hypothetical protein
MASTVDSGNGWQDKEDKFLDKNPSSFVTKDIGTKSRKFFHLARKVLTMYLLAFPAVM